MIKGKSAIVTGSTSGIGLGIATSLAAEGCNLLLNGFGDPKAIEALRAELEAYIADMESEILRVRAEIAAKRKQRGGAESLFKR